jgi:two-component system, LuxR family, sensor kinase FixL
MKISTKSDPLFQDDLYEKCSQTLLNNVVDGIVAIDERGLILLFNPAAENNFGYSFSEVKGRNIKILMPEPYRSQHDQYMKNYIETGRARIIGIGREVVGLRKDGSTFPMDLSVNEMFVDGLRMYGGVVRDITERKQSEDKLKAYANELERSNEELNVFTSAASHDLQEPLRKISLFGDRLETLVSKYDLDAVDYLNRLGTSVERMRLLIEGLLQYSRVSNNQPSFQPTDLNALIHQAIDDLEVPIKDTNAIINVEGLPTIEVDPLQIRRLFQNIISNALKFHRERVPPVINVTSYRTFTGVWKISVKDNGIGLEEKYRDKIFKPFQRLNNRKAYEGTGLGLALCQKIVNFHSGEIAVQSQPEIGTTFIIKLPEKQLTEKTLAKEGVE